METGPKAAAVTNVELHAVLDALSSAVFLLDENRQVLFANQSAGRLFGQVLVGRDFVRTMRHPGCLTVIDAVLGGKSDARSLVTIQGAVTTLYQVNVVALGPAQSGEVYAVVSFDDVSHVHEAEQMRSDFVANVSHELRSPLTALSGFIETLKGAAKEDAAARERFLAVMEREAGRMDRLISDLLSLSKVEVNQRVRPTGKCDVRQIVQRVITMLSLLAEEEHKTVRLEADPAIERLPGDEDQLTQVFQNLIENAVKYSGPGTTVVVTIEALKRAVGIAGPAISIAVSDQGPGIAPAHIPRLTERFYRVDDSRSRDKGGTGLGLAIVKHIVARHRGRLHIKSEVGVGSTFTVFLPMTLDRP